MKLNDMTLADIQGAAERRTQGYALSHRGVAKVTFENSPLPVELVIKK